MAQDSLSGWPWIAVTAAIGVISSSALGQEPKKQPPKPLANEVEALIDRLTEIDQQDIGYSASESGSAFLPLEHRHAGSMMLFQKPSATSETMKSLVKFGAKALPALLKHLNDERPTKINMQGMIVIFRNEEFRTAEEFLKFTFNAKPLYTVMVGDLCYVAIGQIVNRNYWVVRYQPSACIFVTTVPKNKKIVDELAKEWGNFTPDKHRDSLARDVDSGYESCRNGASLRLAYYYPDALEPLAIKQLARPTYSVFPVHDLIREQLYPSKSAQERKVLVDDFVANNGEIARDGIRWYLFQDLDSQEANEQGRLHPKMQEPYRARECLIDIFGLPVNVKSDHRPSTAPLEECVQDRFVQTLCHVRSDKLDAAIKAYRERRLKTVKDRGQ